MKSILKSFSLLVFIFFTNGLNAQSFLSTIQNASYNEVADFFNSNRQYINTRNIWIWDCNNLLDGKGYLWSYALAKPQTFKAADKSKQNFFDSIPAIVFTYIDIMKSEPIIAVYFPELSASMETDKNIPDIQTDLLIGGLKEKKHITVFSYSDIEKSQNSKKFTLCEYLGNLSNHEDVTLGNTIFIKKGLLIKDDLLQMTAFFNNLHTELKSKANTNNISLVVNFQNKQNNYAGLFKIKNGNLIGELHRLNSEKDFATLLSNNISKPLKRNEIYIVSNTKSNNAQSLRKNMAGNGLVLKDLQEITPPSKIYTLEIKKHDGSGSRRYEKIDLEEMKKQLDESNIDCGLGEVCVQTNPNLDLTFECKVGENAVSVKISTEASLELTLKPSDGNSSSISIDKEGKLKITNSREQK